MSGLRFRFHVTEDDYSRTVEPSIIVKTRLNLQGLIPEAIRRVSIALNEGEINMVIHSGGGEVTVTVSPDRVDMVLEDHGKGIPDIEKAMQDGYSTASEVARSLGFGAGMGLPNMKKYTDEMNIDTTVGVGTTITMVVKL